MNSFIQYNTHLIDNKKAYKNNSAARDIHMFIASFARAGKQARPTIEQLCNFCCKTDKPVLAAIELLVDAGYVSYIKGSKGKANVYTLIVTPEQLQARFPLYGAESFSDTQESTTTAPEAPVSVSGEQPVPQQPVVEEVAQKAVESVTEVIPATEGVRHLARRNVPVQVVEQPVVVESGDSLEAILKDSVYLVSSAKHKGCDEYNMKRSLAAGRTVFVDTYGPQSKFRITYLQGKAA